MPLAILVPLSLLVVAVGAVLVAFGFRAVWVTDEALRLRDFVDRLAQPEEVEEVPQLAFRKAELSGTFRTRVLQPWFQALARLLGRFTPVQAVEDMRRQLAIAGNPLGIGPREFFGLRLIVALLAIVFAFLLLRPVTGAGGQAPTAQARLGAQVQGQGASLRSTLYRLAGSVLILYAGNTLPRNWLKRRVRARQNRIRKALPDALDMLSVCADAGLGFDQALQRVSEHWQNPLTHEFNRVVAEMQMGVTRQAALRNMAQRADVADLSSFVAVIIQSDQLGMSIVQTLHSQADQMRVERRFRAQEEARKAPLKMLFPMLTLILPATLAVVIGPSVPAFVEIFSAMRRSVGLGP